MCACYQGAYQHQKAATHQPPKTEQQDQQHPKQQQATTIINTLGVSESGAPPRACEPITVFGYFYIQSVILLPN